MKYKNQYDKARKRWINTVGYSLLSALTVGLLGISLAKELTTREIARLAPTAYAATIRPAPEPELTVPEYIYATARERGLTLDETLQLLAITKCESNFQQYAVNKNKDGSFDLGIMQWNTRYQKQVSRACAFDTACAVHAAIDLYQKSGNWRAWVCGKK